VVDYSNPRLTERAQNRIAHLDWRRRQHGAARGSGTDRRRRAKNAPNESARSRTAGARGGERLAEAAAAARSGRAWRGGIEEGGGRRAGGERERNGVECAAEVYEGLICRIRRGVFGKASLSVGTRSQQCQRQRSVGTCHGYYSLKKNTTILLNGDYGLICIN